MGSDREGPDNRELAIQGHQNQYISEADAPSTHAIQMLLTEFEQIDGARQIVFNKLPACRSSGNTCENTGIGSGVDDKINWTDSFQIRRIANVAVQDAAAFSDQ